MRRVAVLLAGFLVIILPGVVAAQGLLGLPGLPSFGLGNWSGSGSNSCDPVTPGLNCAPAVYVGYGTTDRNGTSFSARTDVPLAGAVYSLEHKYGNRGVWFGASLGCEVRPNIGVLFTGWYFLPTSYVHSNETYFANTGEAPTTLDRTWDTDTKWWFVDGVLALGVPCSGFTLLAGARYDRYETTFKSPTGFPDFGNGLTGSRDRSDVTANNIIPLVGTQYSLNSSVNALTVRVVGIPTLAGDVKYKESILGAQRLEADGNWRGGYFLEVFGDYTYKTGNLGEIGAFGRWNMAHGYATMRTSFNAPVFQLADSREFELSLDRSSWTFGGKIALSFNTPRMPF